MTEDDKDEARHREVLEAIERARAQDALEHGSIIGVTREQQDKTRGHMANEIATVRGVLEGMRGYMDRILKAIRRWLDRMGMGGDDL